MKALKGNRQITISEKRQKEYLSNGYTILDDNGKVIAAPEKDAEKLAKVVDDLKEELKRKENIINELNAKIVELSAKAESEAEDDAEPEAEKAASKGKAKK